VGKYGCGDKYEFWWKDLLSIINVKYVWIGILDSAQVRDYNRDHHVVRCEND